MAIVDRAKQWELVKAIMVACGMPPMERVRSFRLSVSVDECMKVEVETYAQGDGNTEPLKREFQLQAVEHPTRVEQRADFYKAMLSAVPQVGSLWPDAPIQAVASITYTDASCPDCKGTRVYRGLTEEKPCPTCCPEVPPCQ